MSANRHPPTTDGPDADPHGIVPEDFCRNWGATTISEALRIAEQAPSSTPETELPRCPDCGSPSIMTKSCRFADHEQRRDGQWRCRACGSHFDEPTTLAEEGQTELGEWGDRR